MGNSSSVLGRNMNLYYFALFLLLVVTVNGAPKPDPKPIPKAAPKPNPNPKAQMAVIFNNKKHGGTGISYAEEYGMEYAHEGDFPDLNGWYYVYPDTAP